jgi:hypothetical protein
MKTLLAMFRRRRLLAEFVRMNVALQIVQVLEYGKPDELMLVFKRVGRGQKPFAEVRYQDVPRVRVLLSEAEGWFRVQLGKRIDP